MRCFELEKVLYFFHKKYILDVSFNLENFSEGAFVIDRHQKTENSEKGQKSQNKIYN